MGDMQHLVTTVETTTVDENCKGKCGLKNFAADGNCDDENNNCGCNWDNGDCCGKNGNQHQYGYCKMCKCLDPSGTTVPTTKGKTTTAATTDPNCNGVCGAPNFKGDKRCDDNNNNCACDWDGGDCCGTSGGLHQFSYCDKKKGCKCRDPSATTTAPTTTADKNCVGKCGAAAYVGDGNCDDNNNNCGCKWDGGDCCGSNGNKWQYSYCSECKCKDPSVPTQAPKNTTTTTAAATGMVAIAVAHPATSYNGRTARVVNVVTQNLITVVATVRAV